MRRPHLACQPQNDIMLGFIVRLLAALHVCAAGCHSVHRGQGTLQCTAAVSGHMHLAEAASGLDVHTIAQHVSHTAVTSLMNISNTLHTVAGTGALLQWDHAMTSAAWPDLVLAAKKCDTEPKPREGCKASPKLQECCNEGFISKANMCCNSVCLAQAACCKQQECPRHCSAWGPQGLNPKA